MSHASPSTQNRIKLHSSQHTAANAARTSIINSSAQGWSPLKIAKKEGSPLKLSPGMSDGMTSPEQAGLNASPRRTSSSFKHVTKNSLVSNSIFKQSTTPAGLTSAEERVIHERGGRRGMGEAPTPASGVASTPKASIGLGISANAKPRQASRTPSGGGSAVSGTRKVSAERPRVAFPTISGERRVSGERVVSGSKENESPDIRSGKRVPRQSFGLKGLARNEYVSKSPFRRVPSGGLSNDGAARANESPDRPSPSKIPVEKDDLFSSPSPTSAGRRRASPSTFRTRNTSPTPSPPRVSAQPTLGSGVSPSPLGQLPTLAPSSFADLSPSPTPVKSSMTPSRRLKGPRDFGADLYDSPTKSNKTVTFQTVPDVKEFERMSVEGATPEGSFELEAQSEGEEDWADEPADDSLEEILLEPESLDKAVHRQRYVVTNPDLPITETSEDGHAAEEVGNESATAEFMDTLIEEGLFSPPEMDSEAFEDYPHVPLAASDPAPFLSTPSLGDSVHATPLFAGVEPDQMYAETDGAGIPYGRTHHAERNAQAHLQSSPHDEPITQPALHHNRDEHHRMLLNANAAQPSIRRSPDQAQPVPLAHQDGPMPDPFITIQTATNVLSPPREKDRDEGGVPLGRTSHVERMQAARMLATQQLGLGMPRSPAVTKDLQGANSQTMPKPLDVTPSPSPSPESEDVDSEMLFDASFEMSNDGDRTQARQVSDKPAVIGADRLASLKAMVDKEEKEIADVAPGRRLPKPPKVAAVKLPSPISSFVSEKRELPAAEEKSSRFDWSKGFSLPSIGLTSPLVVTPAAMPEASHPDTVSESGSEIDDIDEGDSRHLTPPPAIGQQKKPDSPHRIPSFGDFGDLSFEANEAKKPAAAPTPAPPSPLSAKSSLGKPAPTAMSPSPLASNTAAAKPSPAATSPTPSPRPKSITIDAPQRPVSSPPRASPLSKSVDGASSADAAAAPGASGSTSTKVRQRISREMIRETIQQRLADGTLSRHSSSASGHILDAEIPKRRPVSLGTDKALPPPPPKTPVMEGSTSVPMSKAHTTEAAAPRRSSFLDRPIMRPRSKTQSAEQVIQSNVQDGFINEPKSALDKLMDGMSSMGISKANSPNGGKAILAKPISILQKPKDSTLIPPSPTHMTAPVSASKSSPSPSPSAQKKTASRTTPKGRGKEVAESGSEAKPRRKKGRRSMSTGDVGEEADAARHHRRSAQPRLTLGFKDNESMLDAFKDETDKIGSDRRYKIREKKVPGAKYDGDKIVHNKAGDLDSGASRAWRQLRRPSDMNEHAAALRRMRLKEATDGKTSGTIFVKVLGIESLNIPLPDQETFFCVTLDNGIDYIRTPYIVLKDGARVNQEFSLVEHPNFEFSLSLDVRKDPHILKAIHEKAGGPSHARPTSLLPLSGRETPSSPHRGFRALFSSPRKARPRSEQTGPTGGGGFISASTNSRATTPLPMAPPQPKETIARYLIDDKSPTIGKTHIAFAPIAKNCQAKVLEMRYPVFAMFKSGETAGAGPRARGSSHQPAQTLGEEAQRPMIGKITLQIFRLPPLPGLKQDDLPQCIDEALRGMRHHAWHEHEYHEGVLTQDGGDCANPKRRLFKLIGGALVAINEVTKKQVTSIDLRQATAVIDLNDAKQAAQSQRRKRGSDEGLGVRERSFLIEFKDGEGIIFSADKDEDKALWLETLNGLIGKIPSNPLWAELLAAQKREEEAAATKKVRKVGSSTSLKSAKRSASGLPRSTSGLKKREKEKKDSAAAVA